MSDSPPEKASPFLGLLPRWAPPARRPQGVTTTPQGEVGMKAIRFSPSR